MEDPTLIPRLALTTLGGLFMAALRWLSEAFPDPLPGSWLGWLALALVWIASSVFAVLLVRYDPIERYGPDDPRFEGEPESGLDSDFEPAPPSDGSRI